MTCTVASAIESPASTTTIPPVIDRYVFHMLLGTPLLPFPGRWICAKDRASRNGPTSLADTALPEPLMTVLDVYHVFVTYYGALRPDSRPLERWGLARYPRPGRHQHGMACTRPPRHPRDALAPGTHLLARLRHAGQGAVDRTSTRQTLCPPLACGARTRGHTACDLVMHKAHHRAQLQPDAQGHQ